MFIVQGVGRLTKDVLLKDVKDNKKVAEIYVAAGDDSSLNFVKLEAWDRYAETVKKRLKKGSKIYFYGNLEVKPFIKKDGTPGAELVVKSPQIEFLNYVTTKESENNDDK